MPLPAIDIRKSYCLLVSNLGVNVFHFGQLSYSWAGTAKRIFGSIFLPTPADLSRKDIWFLQQLPVRKRVRSLLVWLWGKITRCRSCHVRTFGTVEWKCIGKVLSASESEPRNYAEGEVEKECAFPLFDCSAALFLAKNSMRVNNSWHTSNFLHRRHAGSWTWKWYLCPIAHMSLFFSFNCLSFPGVCFSENCF